ncbi:RagB/SusD family nutrient uptake outer membrane protein [Daejeonella oryzae]|uniref:RagB/SusD family nutrient uptake outer membrane protein n=1 Tax=Daejeonella oryzae TaxID=1122943 RepID=UPI0003F5A28F|nr:RagB/SusD family nutrient uptake outer membrane protein [Daejeonella oryzae]
MKMIKMILALFLISAISSCKEFLDVKPDAKLAVPSDKLLYLQLMLEDHGTMNMFNPAASDLAVDDVFIPGDKWTALLQAQRTSANAYIWDKDVFNDIDLTDWATSYKAILYSNLILEGLDKLKEESGQVLWKELKGAALFHRAHANFNLLQTFSLAYSEATADNTPGLPLKLSSDINEKLPRASVRQCYDHVLADLEESKTLLPKTVEFKTRVSMTAAAALLARVYLQMQQYELALRNAEEAISASPVLIDYNTLNADAAFPLNRFNEEVIFHSIITGLSGTTPNFGRVSTDLYEMYRPDDLRRTVYYRQSAGEVFFKGSYNGSTSRFSGLATDELYLIAAECYARSNNVTAALNRLNKLLVNRWKTGTFIPLNTPDASEVLSLILDERRKELAFRNRRWSDLKRLNLEPNRQKTIIRNLNGSVYTLEPGDKRYAMPIPRKVIEASGIEQN